MTNTTQSFKVAVIGAGPRGISVVERTLAGYLALPEQDRPALDIAVIDPFNPGPGHVWRTGQSRLFLMNTPCLFPTVVPAGATAAELPASPSGLSFDQWRMLMADTAAGVELPAADREELAGLTPGSFPSRAVYGRYLEWTFARLADAALAAGVALSMSGLKSSASPGRKPAQAGRWKWPAKTRWTPTPSCSPWAICLQR